MNTQFKAGDKVRVVNYGHLVSTPCKGTENSKTTKVDALPSIVGCVGTVAFVKDNRHILLGGIYDKASWYDCEQLELI